MNKYLIALDLDDTLLNYNKEVSKKTKDCLRKLYNNGFIIVIASGRIFDTCYEEVSKLDFINYMVTDSGSLIYDNINKNIVYKKALSKIDVKRIISLYDDKTEYIEFSDEHYYYKYSKNSLNHYGLSRDIGDISEFIKNNKSIHSTIKMYDCTNNKYIIKKVSKYCPTINIIEMKNNDGDKWLELISKGVSKYNALKYIMKKEKVDKNNVIAFGDNYNDIDMIIKSKYGVAMENATNEIKEVANYITKSCNEDGIAFFLGEFFKNEGIYRK